MIHKLIKKQGKIARIEATSEKICGRGGLLFFLRYLENIEVYRLLRSRFDFIKGSKKGFCPDQLLKQLFASYIDGSDMAISGFDRRRADEAYAARMNLTGILLRSMPGGYPYRWAARYSLVTWIIRHRGS